MSEISFTFDGAPHRVIAGHTIAAALIESGVRSWRTTRVSERPRGLFCGMGACFDCLVVVNGQPNMRACMVELADGDDVRSQRGTGHA
jgi:predicted molibdopterin-dependent oxidoreductase YjgC